MLKQQLAANVEEWKTEKCIKSSKSCRWIGEAVILAIECVLDWLLLYAWMCSTVHHSTVLDGGHIDNRNITWVKSWPGEIRAVHHTMKCSCSKRDAIRHNTVQSIVRYRVVPSVRKICSEVDVVTRHSLEPFRWKCPPSCTLNWPFPSPD